MEAVTKLIGVIAIAIGFSLLSAWPTVWIVNYLFPSSLLVTIFGISYLTFWKAFWLNYLCSILFKSTTSSSN